MKTLLFTLLFALTDPLSHAQWTEPPGGVYPTNLLFFGDDVNAGARIEAWGCAAAPDRNVKQVGSASLRFTIQAGVSGAHVLWGGWVKDTTVFWVHDASHVSFWARPSSGRTMISVAIGLMEGQNVVMPPAVIGEAGVWRHFDLIVPAQALDQPLNDLRITFDKVDPGETVHFDDIKISNVRLYAGKGIPPSMKGVYADQIGYDTYGLKTFTGEKYTSYQIVRVADNTPMFTGTDIRAASNKVIGDKICFVGDFTRFQVPGRYRIRLDNGKESYPFDIGPNVYDAPLRGAIRFFYYQRNNAAIEMPFAEGPWVHPKDEKELVLLPDGKHTKLVRKGWHDAGDLAGYVPGTTYALFWLLLAWDDFRYSADNLNIPESGDGIPDILNEARWGLEWVLDMQDASDGGFYHNMCVRSDNRYLYGTVTPDNITGYQLTNKTTGATAAAVGTLAYASRVFADAKLDPAFSMQMREAAKRGWTFLQSNSKEIKITQGCDNYQDPDDIHARFYAAAALFLATGESQYHQYLLGNDPGSQWISDCVNQTNIGYMLYIRSPRADQNKKMQLLHLLAGRAADATKDRNSHPFGFVGYYYWGSLATAFARVGNYCFVDWQANRNLESLFTGLQQIHYTFGQNSLGLVYFSGFGAKSIKQVFHHWLKALNATPHNFPGILPGGPNENPDKGDMRFPGGYSKPPDTPIDARYSDSDSWSTNEPAVNQSAELVYVLAGAYAYAHSASVLPPGGKRMR